MAEEFADDKDELRPRTTILDFLRGRSVRLSGMYAKALRELASAPPSGGETARVSIICHCMRELMNGLPAVMAANITARPDPSSNALVAKLPELLEQHADLDLRAKQDVVPVPSKVANAIADLVDAAVKERGFQVANAAALLTDGTDADHPLIAQWKAAQRFFVSWTHLDRNPDGARPLPADDEILGHITVIEDVIDVRTRLFFANLSAVEDLLLLANAQTDGADE